MTDSSSPSYFKAFLGLLPFFTLHLSSGLSGSFTTILIDHFRIIKDENDSNSVLYETLLGTFEDYGPIFVAVIGGFLQQLFGPKNILIAAGIPSFLSWILVALQPNSVYFLLGSRLLAGFSNGLLTGNVYMSDVAPSEYISSFGSIIAASRSLGATMIFGITLLFYKYGFEYVAFVAVFFPFFGLAGTFFTIESPIFVERVKDIKISEENQQEGKTKTGFALRLEQAKKKLKIPITSPAVYQPMILITCALCVQHFSGFTFTKKFLLQVLKSPVGHSNETSSTTNETSEDKEESLLDQKAYAFAMLINFIRFVSNLIMAKLLRLFRMRFLYFISLFSTAVCLIILGFLEEGTILAPYINVEVEQYMMVSVLALHVFCVQFGLQSLSSQLTSILLPSSSKAIMKGVIRAIQALTLLVFITIMKQFSNHWSFWIMAIGLITFSPLLYTYIPELKNLGRTAGEYFFLPSQTLFYAILPLNEAKKKWIDLGTKVKHASKVLRKISQKQIAVNLEIPEDQTDKSWQMKSFEESSNMNTNITFIPDTIDSLENDERLQKLNKERVCFVTNILGQKGFLNSNDDKSRICIGRGPVRFSDGSMKEGGIFLFNDVVIVARKVKQNRRYINEKVFEFTDNMRMKRQDKSLTFYSNNLPEGVKIEFEKVNNAIMWERYCNYCMDNIDTNTQLGSEEGDSEDDLLMQKTT